MGRERLIERLREGFALDWHGPHGIDHWRRVRDNGLLLAQANGADGEVVELFALLHDAARENAEADPGHGERAADLARALNGEFYELDGDRLDLLQRACAQHLPGSRRDWELTLMTCWDADQLDQGRFGLRPNSMKLLTEAASQRSMQDRAWRRARRWASQLRPEAA